MKNFKQLNIWQKGFDIAVNTYQFASTLPKEEKFGLAKSPERPFPFLPTLRREVAGAAKRITPALLKFRLALVLN